MAIRTLLACLDGQAHDRHVLDLAARVAALDGAAITALYPERALGSLAELREFYGSLDVSSAVWDETMKQRETRRGNACRHFNTWHKKYLASQPQPERPAGLIVEMGIPGPLIEAHARTTDLIVAPLGRDGNAEHLAAILGATGCPILAAPDRNLPLALKSPALVAWNGSKEAGNALRAALPILAHVDDVLVVTIAEDPDMTDAVKPVLTYLDAHGIAARSLPVIGPPGDAGPILLETAASHDAGLLVMGAYGHRKWREIIFGGATRHILDHAKLPVLFAH